MLKPDGTVSSVFYKNASGFSMDKKGDRTEAASSKALQDAFQKRLKGIVRLQDAVIQKV